MDDLISLLDRYYYLAKNQVDDWNFFKSLIDYIQFIEDTPEIEKIADKYNYERINDYKKYQEAEQQVLEETKEAKNELDKLSSLNNISYEELTLLLKEYDNLSDGKTVTTNPQATNLFHALAEIVRSLVANGYKDVFKDFIVMYKSNGQEFIEKYVFAPSIEEKENEYKKLKEKEALSLWGDWVKLSEAYFVIVKGTEFWEELGKKRMLKTPEGSKAILDSLGFATIKGEMDKIQKGSKDSNYFKRIDHEAYLSRIHTNLVNQMSKQKPAEEIKTLDFDPIKSRLFVKGKVIIIRKFSDQYHILRVIFENPKETSQEWFFSELIERIDPKNLDEKRYYNASYQIKGKVAKEGFPDFFITTRQSAKISPKYLS